MNFKNIFLCFTVLFLISIMSGAVFADEAPAMSLVEEGTVSGDVAVHASNPFQTSGSLEYTIPDDVSQIRSANVIVSSYSGSGAPTYALYSNVTLDTGNGVEVLGYEDLRCDIPMANDPTVYRINDHTTKQFSDYQSSYNITDKVNDLSGGDTIKISVENTRNPDYQFDGRIKMIALVFAYDDGDDDKITYWLNVGQSWTQTSRSNLIKTKNFNGEYDEVTFENIATSSYSALCRINDKLIYDPIYEKQGSYFIDDIWDIKDNFKVGIDTNFSYKASESGFGSFKSVVQLLKVSKYNITVNATITPQYKNSVYAGVINNLTVDVSSNKKIDVVVKLYEGKDLIYSENVTLSRGKTLMHCIDSKIRPITENTVNGKDNEKVNYTLVIEDTKGNAIGEINASFVLLYNGYLGKDFEYPNANPTLRQINITGDVTVLKSEIYSSTAATERTDVFNLDLNGTVKAAYVYVPYNWDKNLKYDFNVWNVTFNDVSISHIASYRDQGNLGSFGSYGYGLVVYEVTELVEEGKNTFELKKTFNGSAVYPDALVVLTDKDDSLVESSVYILEEADLLSKNNNRNLAAGFNTTFEITDGNATLYVFAADGQPEEGNIIVNGETYEDVWNGTTYSLDIFAIPVSGNDISVYFESTDSNILGLHQMIVVEHPRIKLGGSVSSAYANTVYAGVNNTLTVTVNNYAAPVQNVTVRVLIGDDEIASYSIDSMDTGENNVFCVVDPTFRPVNENTTNANDNNEYVTYTIAIEDAKGNLINKTNTSFVVLYNGYFAKDLEYPNANPLLREITVAGDVIVLNGDVYSAAGATNRTDVFNLDFNGTVNTALLYVSYNWDKDVNGDFNTWNITFNNVSIAPVASYRDQSNLGTSGRYGYGLIVYNVTDLAVSGENVFAFNKTAKICAVYPSSLIVLTNNDESSIKTAYILEESDLLYTKYNMGLPTGFNTSFEITDGNATLYVFAAGAQSGEGNIIVNGESYENVWNGTANTFDMFKTNVNSTEVEIYFESTGGTILGLHQMIVVEYDNYLNVEVPEVVKYFKGPERLVVYVKDYYGNPASNKTVNITLNGVTYSRTTDENGTASMALGLNSGKYNVTADVDGFKTESSVTILPTVNGTDVVKVFRNATQYYATFRDSEGNYLSNGTEVTFNINGVMYKRYINGNEGKARLNLNLEQGTYVITAINPVNGEMAANNITVIPRIVNNNDLVKYYRNGSQYYVTILGDDGKPVGANETVTFNINGVMYERKTNASGVARLNINLQPGEYVITAMYGGCNVANNITVLPVLTAENVTMSYKDGTKFKATLVDGEGNPLANTNVTFNINGVFYQRTTNATGVAALNINLMSGEYIITSSYNDANIANTIKING